MDELVSPVTRLFTETQNGMRNRPVWLTLARIEKETGLKQAWLSQFTRDKIPNPGVVFVETLNVYLRSVGAIQQ